MDAGIARELGMEGGGQQVALAHQDREVPITGQYLDVATKARFDEPRSADEDGREGNGLGATFESELDSARERIHLRAVGIALELGVEQSEPRRTLAVVLPEQDRSRARAEDREFTARGGIAAGGRVR